ncbi:hypothetical protein AYO47_01860 [Planctomyces sp. SCGC AG-212-M04]|nr:hypothetical protein AYO47_01860 [Planctomyces sp. SCGC AG-212-M04]
MASDGPNSVEKGGSPEVPNWVRDIRPLFTQYEIIKMRSVGQHSIDLASYEDVKKNFRRIYSVVQPNEDPDRAAAGWSKIAYVRIMPLVGERWGQDRISLFKRWADADFPRGDEGPVVAPQDGAAEFVSISTWLTGFDELDPAVADSHLARLRAHPDTQEYIDTLLDRWRSIEPFATEELLSKHIVDDGNLGPVARAIILLWYNGCFHTISGPDGLRRFPSDFGTPQDTQYRHGLVWAVASAHPAGYSVEDNFHWQFAPLPDGRYTGTVPDRFDGVSQ